MKSYFGLIFDVAVFNAFNELDVIRRLAENGIGVRKVEDDHILVIGKAYAKMPNSKLGEPVTLVICETNRENYFEFVQKHGFVELRPIDRGCVLLASS